MKKFKAISSLVLVIVCMFLGGCLEESESAANEEAAVLGEQGGSELEVNDYSGSLYDEINGNTPSFSESDINKSAFEEFSDLDSLGRCGVAFAKVGSSLMPTEERESISHISPSGWHSIEYESVSGGYLYNRSHLIGFQLTGENDNEKNLITGTRYFNAEGMLPFENMVADYIKETDNHVMYRVTPVYEGNDLVAKGVQIEAYSVEDKGDGISFNVFVHNIQPGIDIDYTTGNSKGVADETEFEDTTNDSFIGGEPIRGNKNSKIYHMPGQRDYEEMEDSKNLIEFDTEQDAINAGYRKAKN